MDFIDFTAGGDDDGRRLDRVLRRLLAGVPASACQRLLRKRLIVVNGSRAAADARVRAGDCISVAASVLQGAAAPVPQVPQTGSGAPVPPPFPVLFRNEHLLVVDKPRGIPVQASRAQADCVAARVREWCAQEGGLPGSLSFVPGPLHRLDRQTTGVLAFSQSLRGARWFSDALRARAIRKTYLAMVEGTLPAAVRWQDALEAAPEVSAAAFHTMRVVPGAPPTALTDARPLAYGSHAGRPVTLAECSIGTGRKHQIRVQAAFHGHPLLGDGAYGGHGEAPFFLHARRLGFCADNPLGLPEAVEAPLPADFEEFLNSCLLKSGRGRILM